MKNIFSYYGIDIDDAQIEKFQIYYNLLIEWNQKINLTSITKYEEVVKKHFIDSSLLLKQMNPSVLDGKRILDLGTGAGFPGIPLAILLPNTSFVLVDSLQKRVDFLTEVIQTLRFDHVTVIHGRAESLGKSDKYREQFDFCVSRAVASLPLLLEYCSPFIKVNGQLFLYKSKKVEEEMKIAEHALSTLKCNIVENVKLVEEKEYSRYLLIIEKKEKTPGQYPRREGKPKKSPL